MICNICNDFNLTTKVRVGEWNFNNEKFSNPLLCNECFKKIKEENKNE